MNAPRWKVKLLKRDHAPQPVDAQRTTSCLSERAARMRARELARLHSVEVIQEEDQTLVVDARAYYTAADARAQAREPRASARRERTRSAMSDACAKLAEVVGPELEAGHADFAHGDDGTFVVVVARGRWAQFLRKQIAESTDVGEAAAAAAEEIEA